MYEFDSILPEDFDGTFRFTNASDEDFVGLWGGKQYLYPSRKTTPMVIFDATPLEVQNIRKKFAKDLAVREFFKGPKGKSLTATEKNADGSARFNSIHQAAQYSDDDLKQYIQECLTPLPIAPATASQAPKENLEDRLSKDEEGEIITQAVDQKKSLRKKALEAGAK